MSEYKPLTHEERFKIAKDAEKLAFDICLIRDKLQEIDSLLADDIVTLTDGDGTWTTGTGVDFEHDYFSKHAKANALLDDIDDYVKYIDELKKREDKQ